MWVDRTQGRAARACPRAVACDPVARHWLQGLFARRGAIDHCEITHLVTIIPAAGSCVWMARVTIR
jgi:hypothetical protein